MPLARLILFHAAVGLDDLVEHEGHGRPRFPARVVAGRFPLEEGLGEFEVPVAEGVPREAVGAVGRVVEAVGLDRARHLGERLGRLAQHPAVQRQPDLARVEAGDADTAVHLGEAGGVPDLGREAAVALDALHRELDVAALRRHGRQREAQRVGATRACSCAGTSSCQP